MADLIEYEWINVRDLDRVADVRHWALYNMTRRGRLRGRKSLEWGGWTKDAGWLTVEDVEAFREWWAGRQPGRWPATTFDAANWKRGDGKRRKATPTLLSTSGIAWLICFPDYGRVLTEKQQAALMAAWSYKQEAMVDRAILQDVDLAALQAVHANTFSGKMMAWARGLFASGLPKVRIHPRGRRNEYQRYMMDGEFQFSYTTHRALVAFARKAAETPARAQVLSAGPRWGMMPIDMRISPLETGGYAVQLPRARRKKRFPHTNYRPDLDLLYLDKARKYALSLWADEGMRAR